MLIPFYHSSQDFSFKVKAAVVAKSICPLKCKAKIEVGCQ